VKEIKIVPKMFCSHIIYLKIKQLLGLACVPPGIWPRTTG